MWLRYFSCFGPSLPSISRYGSWHNILIQDPTFFMSDIWLPTFKIVCVFFKKNIFGRFSVSFKLIPKQSFNPDRGKEKRKEERKVDGREEREGKAAPLSSSWWTEMVRAEQCRQETPVWREKDEKEKGSKRWLGPGWWMPRCQLR